MRIGVPKEIKPQENRIGLTPESVQVLVSNGHKVLVENNGGFEAGFYNNQYIKAGAAIVDKAEDIFNDSEIIVKVKEPLTNEILLKFKSTGGFNDEIDITYSGILCFIAAKKLNKDPAELILDVLNNADDSGIAYIEDFLNKIDVDIADIKSRLGYPSTD